jgi:outer membrane protein, heavy metal efflux system
MLARMQPGRRSRVCRGGTVASAVALAFQLCRAEPLLAETLSLGDALARARTANPDVQTDAAEVAAAHGRLRQADTYPANPVLSVDAADHQSPDARQVDRGVELAQEIEIGGQATLRHTAAAHDLTHAELTLADRMRTIEATVRRAFAELVAAEQRLALARESAALAHALADTARRRERAGDVGALDVHMSDLEDVRAAQAVATMESERARAESRLAAAIGAPATEALQVVPSDAPTPPLPGEAALVAHALASRADLRAAREAEAQLATEADLVRRRADVPNLTVRGYYREELDAERIAGGGLSIALPVFNREIGSETALRAAARGQGVTVRRLEESIPREVRSALARRHAADAARERYARAAPDAIRDADALITSGYASGYLGLPDVLSERDRLLQARGAAIGVWLDAQEADADLLEAIGGTLP